MDQPVMFRAGRAETAYRAAAPLESVPETVAGAGASTYLADISEFQPDLIDAKYLAWSKACIIRAAYGDAHDDRAWYGGARRSALLAGGARFLGIYQYLVAGQDAAVQARALVKLVGPRLNTGEMIIADVEEGSGSQAARLSAWASVIKDAYGIAPWSYSGLSFASAHGIAPVTWLAAYQSAEPATRHVLWQFTDAYSVPGAGSCDCSVYRGTIAQLAALAYGGSAPAPVTPPAPPPAPARAPAFPYASADYLGTESADPHCHSGALPADQPHVRTWQAQMHARGWVITADGSFGAQSLSVARAFQAQVHLAVDGKVGPATWSASWTARVT